MIVAILGMGKTGTSLAKYWQGQGAEVWGIDDNPTLGNSDAARTVSKLFLKGELPDFRQVQRFFISPGIDPKHPAATAAWSHGLKLEGELDLAFSLCKGEIIAVTGTNGKSTTVSLLGEILSTAGENVGVGGNLGIPFLDLVTDPRAFTKFVVEVSSYQLETTEKFRPRIAALLNITDDHLDRYANLQEYAQAKGRIFSFQSPEDYAVYNDDDLHVLEAMESVSIPKKIPFSVSKKVPGAHATANQILWTPEAGLPSAFELANCKLMGLHNLENISCAVACAKLAGIDDRSIQKTLESFQGLPHRIEWVAQIEGVNYYDDSKATNVGAVVMSLASFDQDVVLILGGRDKGGDYAPLKPLVRNKAKAIVLMGEAKDLIRKTLEGCCELRTVSSMQEAVAEAKRLAPPGGTVLLSPACSSFDMFKDYHDRGEQFKNAVKAL